MSNGSPILEQQLTPRLEAPIAGRLAPTPYNFELTAAEAIRLTVHNSQTGVVVSVHVRVLHPRQGIVANAYQYTPSADRSADWDDWFIGDGFLLNATAFASAGAPRRGQTFIRLQIVRGQGAARTVLGTLLQGYITENQDLAWPGSPLQGSLEGDGYYRTITGTNPAAGTEITETVPAGARWDLTTFHVILDTSATAINRRPVIALYSGTGLIFEANNPLQVPASSGGVLFWSQGTPLEAAPPTLLGTGPLPTPAILLAGHQILTTTGNLQGGDNYRAPVYTVKEWLEAQ